MILYLLVQKITTYIFTHRQTAAPIWGPNDLLEVLIFSPGCELVQMHSKSNHFLLIKVASSWVFAFLIYFDICILRDSQRDLSFRIFFICIFSGTFSLCNCPFDIGFNFLTTPFSHGTGGEWTTCGFYINFKASFGCKIYLKELCIILWAQTQFVSHNLCQFVSKILHLKSLLYQPLF